MNDVAGVIEDVEEIAILLPRILTQIVDVDVPQILTSHHTHGPAPQLHTMDVPMPPVMTQDARLERVKQRFDRTACAIKNGPARQPFRSRRSSPFTSSTSSQRTERCSHRTPLRKSLHRLYISPSRSKERR